MGASVDTVRAVTTSNLHPLAFRCVSGLLGTYSRIAPTGRGGYRLSRFARSLLPSQRRSGEFVTRDGLVLKLDLATYPDCAMAFGLYELETARLIRQTLRPGDHFVDGGANLGYFTLLAAHRVGPTGRVDAFEPEPHNRQRLLDHLERNGLADRVRVHDTALSDAQGEARIHFFRDGHANHGCSSLFAEAGDVSNAEVTLVRTVRMDEALAGTTPRLIKLDLEGAEHLAVHGMTGLLTAEQPPLVIAEYDRHQASFERGFEGSYVETVCAVQPAYRVSIVGEGRSRYTMPAEVLASIKRQCNLLFRPVVGSAP